MLNLKQIETFRAIMHAGSISGAAKALFISQPAVSRQLSYIEQTLGYDLFVRAKGQIEPTEEAKILFEKLDDVYLAVREVQELAYELGQKHTYSFHVVSSPSIGYSILPACLVGIRRQYPSVRLRYTTLNAEALVRTIADGQADLGIVYAPTAHPNVESRALGTVPMVCILPAAHPLKEYASISPHALASSDCIHYRYGTPFGKMMTTFLGAHSRLQDVGIEVDSQQHMCDLVEAGAGIGLVDILTAKRRASSRLVVKPILPQIQLPIHAIHSKHNRLTTIGRQFADLVKKEVMHGRRPATDLYLV